MSTLNLKNDKYESLEKVYTAGKSEMNRIRKPVINDSGLGKFQKILFVIIIIIIVFSTYFFFLKKNDNYEIDLSSNWYSVKLINGEVYFGQVDSLDSDPVNLRNVYYNYDQKKGDTTIEEDKNLRLVKRGQETHGPTGTMSIIRSQILYLEPLKNDSKVLNAILNYEN
jgi:hypothetical protein